MFISAVFSNSINLAEVILISSVFMIYVVKEPFENQFRDVSLSAKQTELAI